MLLRRLFARRRLPQGVCARGRERDSTGQGTCNMPHNTIVRGRTLCIKEAR